MSPLRIVVLYESDFNSSPGKFPTCQRSALMATLDYRMIDLRAT